MSSEDSAANSLYGLPWPEQYRALAEKSKSPILKRFYESGCVSPETPISDVPMVAMDFETTGLDAKQHSIVSIGLVPFTLDGIQLAKARHWVVRPKLPLHQTSVTFHGITHSDIDKAPDLDEIMEDLFACLNRYGWLPGNRHEGG